MPSPLSIVLVEDHEKVRVSTAKFLRKHGHQVFELECVEDMEEIVGGARAHLFILDLNLPGEDGLVFARRLREIQPNVGIIMMTARSGSDHVARGYQEGADVYLVKPIAPEVLLGAIESIRRRLPQNTQQSETHFRLDLSVLTLTGPTGNVILNPSESAMLVGLMRSPHRMLDVYQLSELMGLSSESFNQSSMVVRIVRLRKKLVAVGADRACIKTQRSAGYLLSIPIEIR